MTGPRRRSEDTRLRLLEEGVSQLLHRGYHGTGIQSVVDAAGLPKGSFYNYFESKEQFAAAAVAHYAAGLAQALDDAVAKAPDPLAGLDAYFEWELAELARADFRGGCLVGNLGAELEEDGPCRDALIAAHTGFRDRVARVLEEAQRTGLVRRDIPAADLADLLVDTWEGGLLRMKMERSVRPLRRGLEHLLHGYLRA